MTPRRLAFLSSLGMLVTGLSVYRMTPPRPPTVMVAARLFPGALAADVPATPPSGNIENPSPSESPSAAALRAPERRPRPTPSSAPSSPPSSPSASPSVPPKPGTLMVVAIGGTCIFSLNGFDVGEGTSLTLAVDPGTYLVVCQSADKTRHPSVKTVEAGKPALAVFRLR